MKIIWFLITLWQKKLFFLTELWRGELEIMNLVSGCCVRPGQKREPRKNILVFHDPNLWVEFLLIIIYSIHHLDSWYIFSVSSHDNIFSDVPYVIFLNLTEAGIGWGGKIYLNYLIFNININDSLSEIPSANDSSFGQTSNWNEINHDGRSVF